MSKMKEKNLRRFVALYIAGSVAFGGVAYAEEQYQDHYMEGTATVIDDATYQGDGVFGGSHNKDVVTSDITISGNGTADEVFGGGEAEAGANASANVGNATIKVNGGQIGDVFAGGSAWGGSTANITGKSTIDITGGTLESVTGGGIANSGHVSVKESVITISDGTIGFIHGGGVAKGDNATSNVDKTTITINGGTIGDGTDAGDEFFGGGFANVGTAAGSENVSDVGDVTININGGTLRNSLYGGGHSTDEDKDVHTPGLGSASTHVNAVNITISGVTTDGEDVAFYAGGKTSGANTESSVDTASITLKNNAAVDEIYGGGDSYIGTTTVDAATISVQDAAKAGMIFGGGFSESGLSNVGTAAIDIKDNAKVGTIYGGGYGYQTEYDPAGSTTVGNTTINIQDNAVVDALYGGGLSEGTSSSSKVTNSTINISGGTIGSINAGGADANSTVDNSTINISSGTVSGDISRGNATAAALNFTAGTGSTIGGMISGFDTVTVREDAMTTLTGADMNADESHGFTTLAVEQRGTLNISGGTFNADITGAGATKESALNFTAGKGSTISKTVSGFDTVTVATGAKTNWTGNDLTHNFGSLTVADGGAINIVGKAVTFDFEQNTPVAYSSKMARAVQNGNFNVKGSVNLAQGTTLTMQNGTVTTTGKGAFFSEVDKDNFANSGKVAWGTGANVEGDLQAGFVNLTNTELVGMGKTDKFGNLLTITMNPENLTEGQVIKNPKAGLTSFEAKINPDGTLNIIDAPHTSERGVGYYTGVRQGNAYINHTIVENIHEHTADLRNGEKGNEFWASIRGGSTDVDTGFGEAEVKTQYYQLGYDWDLSTDKQKTAIGLYFTKIAGDSTQNGFKNDIDSAYDFGIYGMKEFGGGNYVSLIGRYGQIGNSLRTDVQTTEWKDKGYGLSMEFGNRNTQANGLMLEPYIQFNYNHYSSVDFTVGADRAGMDSDSMLDGKLGLRLIKQEADNPNNTIFGGIAYTKGLSGDFSLRDRTNGEKLGGTDNDASAFELSVGVNRQISKCSTVNLNAKKEFGDYDGWSVQGMVNVNF